MFTRTLSEAKTMTPPDVGTTFSAEAPWTARNEKSSDDPIHRRRPRINSFPSEASDFASIQ
jgi:hypothetical protein